MFVVGAGRVHADEVVEGDRIRNAGLHELTVLSIEADTRPQIVHNLEIADAHTYFAGEFEAWGHNSDKRKSLIEFAISLFISVCGELADGPNGDISANDPFEIHELGADGSKRPDKKTTLAPNPTVVAKDNHARITHRRAV